MVSKTSNNMILSNSINNILEIALQHSENQIIKYIILQGIVLIHVHLSHRSSLQLQSIFDKD
jgi:hypothetical protein